MTYSARVSLDVVDEEGFLKDSNVIMGGDSNLVTSSCDIWVVNSKLDLLVGYFSSLYMGWGLLTLNPFLCFLQDGHTGEDGIAKWLDFFLVAYSFLLYFEKFCLWVGSKAIYDHRPIWHQFDLKDNWKPMPFKLNHKWLEEKDFCELVVKRWVSYS